MAGMAEAAGKPRAARPMAWRYGSDSGCVLLATSVAAPS
jgi:hypothetical protein